MTKQTFLALICWMTMLLANAGNKPTDLRYDFKVGDEFVVQVSNFAILESGNYILGHSYQESRTSKTYFFTFRPLQKHQDSTKMEVEISRMVAWNKSYCFDTHAGQAPLTKWDRWLQKMAGLKYTFVIDMFGEVKNLTEHPDNAEKLFENAASFAEYRTNENLKHWNNCSGRVNYALRRAVQCAFPVFYSEEVVNNKELAKDDPYWPMGTLSQTDKSGLIEFKSSIHLFFSPMERKCWYPVL